MADAGQRNADLVLTVRLLARGLCDIYEQTQSGMAVFQDARMPPSARRACARLSRHCVEAGVPDIGASIHLVMDRLGSALSEWGVPQWTGAFAYSDVVLGDPELGVPSADCETLARGAGSEINAQEELHHEQLRGTVQAYPERDRVEAYTALREFVVRRPALPYAELSTWVVAAGHIPALRFLSSLYRPAPHAAYFGGKLRTCSHCGALLWPDPKDSVREGRCRIRQCRLSHPTAAIGEEIDAPETWRAAPPAVLAYWVGPAQDELLIHDTLVAAGRQVHLYPMMDAADIGLDGLALGIDVKTYASPLLLGSRLTRSIGRLEIFARRIIAVPDYKLSQNRDYLRQLKDAYQGSASLEFRTTSDVLGEFAR